MGVLFGRKPKLDAEWEAKLRQCEGDLATTRADLAALRAKSAGYQTELDASAAQLRKKEAELAELQARFAALSTVEAALKTKDNELARLKADLAGWGLKLKEVEEKTAREIAAALAAAPDAKLTAELNTLKGSLTGKESEIAKLLDRIKEFAPLKLQLTERELRIKALEARIGAADKVKDDELAQLKLALDAAHQAKAEETARLSARIVGLESLGGQLEALKQQLSDRDDRLRERDDRLRELDNQLFDLENKIKEVEHARLTAVAERESENQRLRLWLGALEAAATGATALTADALPPEHEARLRDAAAAHRMQLGEKDAELSRLHAQLNELKRASAAKLDPPSEAGAHAGRDAEVIRLRARILQLERASAAARNRQGGDDAGGAAALQDKDAALAALQLRVKELEPLAEQLAARDRRLAELEAHLAAVNEQLAASARDDELAQLRLQLIEAGQAKDAEINRLMLRLRELESVSVEATNLQIQLMVEQSEREAEQGGFHTRLAEREAELASLHREWTNALNHKDAELRRLHEQFGAHETSRQQIAAALAEETGKLRWRSGELEAFLSQRDEEIGKLKWRIGELEAVGGQVAEREAWLAERDGKLREWEANFTRALAEKDDEIGKLRWRLAELETHTEQRAAQSGELETRYRATLSVKERELAQLAERVAELNALGAQLADRDARLHAWEIRYRLAVGERDSQIAHLTTRLAELGALNARAAEREQELAHLHFRVRELEAVAVEQQQLAELLRRKEAEVERLRARLNELKAAVKPAAAPAVAPTSPKKTKAAAPTPARKQNANAVMETYRKNPPRKGQSDDLKLIHGIGPALEKLLHKLGIYFFKQVATWNEADIDYVDEQLGQFKGRIRRAKWAASARKAHFKQYGEKL